MATRHKRPEPPRPEGGEERREQVASPQRPESADERHWRGHGDDAEETEPPMLLE